MKKIFFLYFVFAVCIVLLRVYFFSIATIEGASMEPTLKEGDWVLMSRILNSIKPGDIVVLKIPEANNLLVKRVITHGQSEVFVEDSAVFVNGKRIEETAKYPIKWNKYLFYCNYSRRYKLDDDQIFLMGDNRCFSSDSRHWGPAKKKDLVGKVIFKIPKIIN